MEKRGVYYFDSKPFIVKGWNPKMDLNIKSIKSLPLWVQFLDLDIKYWGLESLSKLGSIIGIPLKTDKYTKEKSMIKYARLLIEVSMEGPFPELIEFFNENQVLIRQQVKFEWQPSKCTHCGMYGHLEEVCRKKHTQRKEWRRVQPDPQQEATEVQAPIVIEVENFIAVSQRAAAKQTQQPTAATDQHHNTFQALLIEELVDQGRDTQLVIAPND